jgi:hypothetical protein
VIDIIEDFEYQEEGSGTHSDDEDGEDGEDGLEYPGGMAKSIVCPFYHHYLQQS